MNSLWNTCFPHQVLFENFFISAQNVLVIFDFLKLWFESVNWCENLYQNAWLKILRLINFLCIMQMFDLQLSPTPEFYLDSDNIKVPLKLISCPLENLDDPSHRWPRKGNIKRRKFKRLKLLRCFTGCLRMPAVNVVLWLQLPRILAFSVLRLDIQVLGWRHLT